VLLRYAFVELKDFDRGSACDLVVSVPREQRSRLVDAAIRGLKGNVTKSDTRGVACQLNVKNGFNLNALLVGLFSTRKAK